MLRLLNAADHRVRPRTAAGGSEGSQEKSREPRSPTSRCTARLRLLQMAVVGRFKQELATIPHDQLLVLVGPSASSAGRAVGDTGRERRGRFTCDFAKVTTLWSTPAWRLDGTPRHYYHNLSKLRFAAAGPRLTEPCEFQLAHTTFSILVACGNASHSISNAQYTWQHEIHQYRRYS